MVYWELNLLANLQAMRSKYISRCSQRPVQCASMPGVLFHQCKDCCTGMACDTRAALKGLLSLRRIEIFAHLKFVPKSL